MEKQNRLQRKTDALRERIRELELLMQGIDRENMNEQTLEPIDAHFKKLIYDVVGIDNMDVSNWKWVLGYNLDYYMVLDYVMNEESGLTKWDRWGLQMMKIPLDIIVVWIQFVRILFGLSLMEFESSTVQRVNENLDVIERTVNIMQRIVLAANTKSIGPTLKYRNALSTYGQNIIPDFREIIYPYFTAEDRLSRTFFRVPFFSETTHIWESFRYIRTFIRITCMNKVLDRFEKKDEQSSSQEGHIPMNTSAPCTPPSR